jgi:hypothetical protein
MAGAAGIPIGATCLADRQIAIPVFEFKASTARFAARIGGVVRKTHDPRFPEI